MGPVRRNQLIEAAISSLHDYGYADTTVARIAKKAGVSKPIYPKVDIATLAETAKLDDTLESSWIARDQFDDIERFMKRAVKSGAYGHTIRRQMGNMNYNP